MKILLDTNIIIDMFEDRQPYSTDAKEILIGVEKGILKGYITANAVADIFYLCKRSRSIEETRAVLKFLLDKLEVISVTHKDCVNAMVTTISDFEDALFVTCSKKERIDYVITRDEKLLISSELSNAMLPDRFLSLLENWVQSN